MQKEKSKKNIMCIVTYYQSKTCKHMWAVISRPCAPFMGFTTCLSFTGGGSISSTLVSTPIAANMKSQVEKLKPTPKIYKTKCRACPRCDLHGVYDANAIRVVEKMGYGLTWGMEPDGGWGIDVRFGSCVIL